MNSEDRIVSAIELLKRSRLKGLAFPAAKQALKDDGFTDAEINIAASRFSYASLHSGSPEDLAIAEHKAKEEAMDYSKRQVIKSGFGALLGGYVGQYFSNKAVRGFADYQDLKHGKAQTGRRVYDRNRLVRYYAWISAITLVLASPYAIGGIANLLQAPQIYIDRVAVSPVYGLLIFWVVGFYVGYLVTTLVLFLATKEATIKLTIYGAVALMILFFVALAVIIGSAMPLVGIVFVLPAVWINRQVGLLSRL